LIGGISSYKVRYFFYRYISLFYSTYYYNVYNIYIIILYIISNHLLSLGKSPHRVVILTSSLNWSSTLGIWSNLQFHHFPATDIATCVEAVATHFTVSYLHASVRTHIKSGISTLDISTDDKWSRTLGCWGVT
jgi:hypothetical protein